MRKKRNEKKRGRVMGANGADGEITFVPSHNPL
jgi:hypothetical protein